MNRKISGTPSKGVVKYQTLAKRREKNQYVTIVTPKTESIPKQYEVKYKPIVKKFGKNYLEMSCDSCIRPIVFEVSPTFKPHEVNPKLKRIAQLMKKSSIAGIRRMGFDIIDD